MKKAAVVISTLLSASLLGAKDAPARMAPEQPSRIVFIGDSITAGVGVSDQNTSRYSTVVTRLLQQKNPEAYEVNLALSGQALCQQAPSYAADILQHAPDALVIQWGVNDHYWGYSLAQFIARYEQLVGTIRAKRPSMPLILTTLVADFRWPENRDWWIGGANLGIQEIATRYQCRIAYVHRALGHDQEFYADTIHPNERGAERMAEAIATAFEAHPLSSDHLSVQFDQGSEIRFMRYVFIPRWTGSESQWIRVTGLSKSGMRLETPIPIAIRTPAIYNQGETYRVTTQDAAGQLLQSIEQTVNWNRMLQLNVDPGTSPSPLKIAIAPIKELAP